MAPKFKKETYGAPEINVIRLSRKQILQMAEMVQKFDDVDDFELHLSYASGIGQSMNFKFTLNLDTGPADVKTDVTDVSKW